MLYNFAEREGDEELAGLTVVRTGQRVFTKIISDYLTNITYGDEWASVVRLPVFGSADVLVDPTRAFGQPFFKH